MNEILTNAPDSPTPSRDDSAPITSHVSTGPSIQESAPADGDSQHSTTPILPQSSETAASPQPSINPPIHQSAAAAPPQPPSSRYRRGRVARLSKDVRDEINWMLDEGLPYSAIIQGLGEDLTDDCIARWKKGGYQDYLREQRLLDQSRLRYELSLELASQQEGVDVFQGANKMAAALICEAVAEVGADSLRAAIQANPLNMFRMLNSLSRLTAGGLKCERHMFDAADRERHLENARKYEHHDLSPETLAAFEKARHLL